MAKKLFGTEFTIQNVSIKYFLLTYQVQNDKNLQYKMFLLNCKENGLIMDNMLIYNTKCFY